MQRYYAYYCTVAGGQQYLQSADKCNNTAYWRDITIKKCTNMLIVNGRKLMQITFILIERMFLEMRVVVPAKQFTLNAFHNVKVWREPAISSKNSLILLLTFFETDRNSRIRTIEKHDVKPADDKKAAGYL
uniref:Uncharacterized protein n=1 Tax=Steinernema glaseri TaxID=37863 RepID=A0A1I8AUT0_9BILA